MSGFDMRRLRVSRLNIGRFNMGRQGNIAALTAMLMPVLIGAAGLASDTAQWVLMRRALQRQADSAALAGAYALTQGRTAFSGASLDLGKNQNFTLTAAPVIENAPSIGPWAGNTDAVRVRLVATSNLPFSSLFMGGGTVISAEAVAGLQQDGDYCILALDTTASLGITNTGNTTVDARCGMHSNSTGEPAVAGNGSAVIYASPVSAVGNIAQSSNFAAGTVFTPYNTAQRDPYAGLPDPAIVSGGPQVNVGSNQTRNLSPGTYRDFRVQGTANLAPGVYYIDGRNGGGLDIGAQAVLRGTGVTFVLTNSNFTSSTSTGTSAGVRINGGATLDLAAPDAGTFKGVLIYQDRRTTAMSDTLQINGNSMSRLRGALYAPRNEMLFNGTSGMNIDCLQMVGYRITFTGNSNLRNICPANSGSTAFKGNIVRLLG